MNVLFVSAENAALPGGKVGGIGDVVRDLPVALADEGCAVTVLTPAYGFLHALPGAQLLRAVEVSFGGRLEQASLFTVPGPDSRVQHLVLEHALLSPHGAGKIYCDDGPERPFASDAHKFAFFCACVAAYLGGDTALPDVVHLHDWHAAMLLFLREYAPGHAHLRSLRCVYTVHNLALQGIRPVRDDASSLQAWFPSLGYDAAVVGDPRYADCINPMALAIRLADRINTVSPTYAQEILQPDDPAHGFFGGEGLERDTQAAAAGDRLVGILNGCMYPATRWRRGWQPLARMLATLADVHDPDAGLADCLQRFARRRPRTIVTSVGRMTKQKVALLLEPVTPGVTALDAILQRLGESSLLLLLGNGDPQLEQRMAAITAKYPQALFICGFHEALAECMYECGDLFLMPSSFEPCGISQMLAMRAGQPCVVHGVGGLRDTVSHNETGFVFNGATPGEQATALVAAVDAALTLRTHDTTRWQSIRREAAAQRFSWARAARAYVETLYCGDAGAS